MTVAFGLLIALLADDASVERTVWNTCLQLLIVKTKDTFCIISEVMNSDLLNCGNTERLAVPVQDMTQPKVTE